MKQTALLFSVFIIFCTNTFAQDSIKTQHLKEVSIEAEKHKTYTDTTTELGTRTTTKLIDIPQSIAIVNQKVIKDQQIFTINEATKNMAGVTTYAPYSYYVMRGFSTNYDMSNFTTNGVRGSFYDFSQQPTTYNVESVEAVKGPASALFSVGAPGGIINTTTKQPKDVASTEVTATYGSFNTYRFTADATGPLSKNKKVLYRLIVGTQNQNSFRDYVKGQNYFTAASLTYIFSDKTKITGEFNGQYDNTNIAYDRGIVATTNPNGGYNFNAVPLSWSRHNPNDNGSRKNISGQIKFQHKFNEHVSFISLERYTQYKLVNNEFDSWGGAPTNTDTIADRIYEKYNQQYYSINSNNYLNFKFNTGSIKHNLLTGFDIGMYKNPTQYNVYGAPSISVLNPTVSNDAPNYNSVEYSQNVKDKNVVIGGYIQDQIDLTKKVKALLGLRYDTYNFTLNYQIPVDSPMATSVTKASKLLPRVGLVYEPIKSLAIYGSYCESYNPNWANYALGGSFAPETGTQYEFGIKKESFKGRLMTTLAVYQINKTNVLEPNPNDPTGLRQLNAGSATSKGVEVSIQGQITSNLNIIANYAYNEAKITKDTINPANVGNMLPCAPLNSANVWLKYSFSKLIKGLGIAAGVQYVDKRAVSVPNNNFEIPAYTSYQAGVNYQIKKSTSL